MLKMSVVKNCLLSCQNISPQQSAYFTSNSSNLLLKQLEIFTSVVRNIFLVVNFTSVVSIFTSVVKFVRQQSKILPLIVSIFVSRSTKYSPRGKKCPFSCQNFHLSTKKIQLSCLNFQLGQVITFTTIYHQNFYHGNQYIHLRD